MYRTPGRPAFLLLAALFIAACGGGGAASPGGGASPASGGAADPTATADASTPSEAAATGDPAEPPASEPAAGGGTASDTCGLVTVAEMEALFGVTGVTQELFAGPPDTCDYQRDSAPFVAMVLTPQASSFIFDAMAAEPGAQPIAGLGDRAVYSPQQLLLVIEKGGSLLSIAILDESRSEAERLELMQQIGATATGRM